MAHILTRIYIGSFMFFWRSDVKIGIMGTHGIGKTTFAAQMFAHASRTGRKAKLLHEVARSCPLPINDKFTVKAATWIISRHITLGLDAEAQGYDYIICDRSSFDPIAYAINIAPQDIVEKKIYRTSPLYRFAERDLQSYDILIYIRPSGSKIISDGIRAIDPDFQKKIDKILITELNHLGIYFSSYEKHPIMDFNSRYISIDSSTIFEEDNSSFFEYIFNKKSLPFTDKSNNFFNFCPYTERVQGNIYD